MHRTVEEFMDNRGLVCVNDGRGMRINVARGTVMLGLVIGMGGDDREI